MEKKLPSNKASRHQSDWGSEDSRGQIHPRDGTHLQVQGEDGVTGRAALQQQLAGTEGCPTRQRHAGRLGERRCERGAPAGIRGKGLTLRSPNALWTAPLESQGTRLSGACLGWRGGNDGVSSQRRKAGGNLAPDLGEREGRSAWGTLLILEPPRTLGTMTLNLGVW